MNCIENWEKDSQTKLWGETIIDLYKQMIRKQTGWGGCGIDNIVIFSAHMIPKVDMEARFDMNLNIDYDEQYIPTFYLLH